MSRLTLVPGHPATVGDALSVVLPDRLWPRLPGLAYGRVGPPSPDIEGPGSVLGGFTLAQYLTSVGLDVSRTCRASTAP